MIIFLFLKGAQLAKIKSKFSEINLIYKILNKKKLKPNKGKIVIKVQKLRSK